MESMADAEITIDKRCRVILLNGEAERLTGWCTRRPLRSDEKNGFQGYYFSEPLPGKI